MAAIDKDLRQVTFYRFYPDGNIEKVSEKMSIDASLDFLTAELAKEKK